jgi:hypothetical protein
LPKFTSLHSGGVVAKNNTYGLTACICEATAVAPAAEMSTTGLKDSFRVGHKLHWCDIVGWAQFYKKKLLICGV